MFKSLLKSIKSAQFSALELKMRHATAHEGPFPTQFELEDIAAGVQESEEEFQSIWLVLLPRLADSSFPMHVHKSLSLLVYLCAKISHPHYHGLLITALIDRMDLIQHLCQSTQYTEAVQNLALQVKEFVETHARTPAATGPAPPPPPRPSGPPPTVSATARATAAANAANAAAAAAAASTSPSTEFVVYSHSGRVLSTGPHGDAAAGGGPPAQHYGSAAGVARAVAGAPIVGASEPPSRPLSAAPGGDQVEVDVAAAAAAAAAAHAAGAESGLFVYSTEQYDLVVGGASPRAAAVDAAGAGAGRRGRRASTGEDLADLGAVDPLVGARAQPAGGHSKKRSVGAGLDVGLLGGSGGGDLV